MLSSIDFQIRVKAIDIESVGYIGNGTGG